MIKLKLNTLKKIDVFHRIPSISAEVTSRIIDAYQESVRATWTREMANEMGTFRHIDAEAELTRLLQEAVNERVSYRTFQDQYLAQPIWVSSRGAGFMDVGVHLTHTLNHINFTINDDTDEFTTDD